jgi:hypothetical protein
MRLEVSRKIEKKMVGLRLNHLFKERLRVETIFVFMHNCIKLTSSYGRKGYQTKVQVVQNVMALFSIHIWVSTLLQLYFRDRNHWNHPGEDP